MTVLRHMVIYLFLFSLVTSLLAHPIQLCEIENRLASLNLLVSLKLSNEQQMNCHRIAIDAQVHRKRSLIAWRSYLNELTKKKKAPKPLIPLGGRVAVHVAKIKNLLSEQQLEKIQLFRNGASHLRENSLDGEEQFLSTLTTVRQMSDGQWQQYKKDIAEKLRGQALTASFQSRLSLNEKISKYMLRPELYSLNEKKLIKSKDRPAAVPSDRSWWKPKEKWQTIKRNDNAVLP